MIIPIGGSGGGGGSTWFNVVIVSGSGSSVSTDSLLSNITLDLSAGGTVLSDCTFIGAGETLVFPAGYTATGKTFISGVSSNFEYELDLSDTAIYNATTAADGWGKITMPAGLGWVGSFTLSGAFYELSEIANFAPYAGYATFKPDAITGGSVAIPKYVGGAANTIIRAFTTQVPGTYGVVMDYASSTNYSEILIKKQGDVLILEKIKNCNETA